MSEQDDRDWLATLAGKPAAGADPATVNEAAAVRRALQAAREREQAPDMDVDGGLQRLLFRLRRDGLGGGRPAWVYPSLALAATVVIAAGIVLLQPAVIDDEPVYRGAPGTPPVLVVENPAQRGEALVAELASLGVTARITQFGANVTLEAEWPAQTGPAHTAFLQRNGLQPPAGGRLVIELRSLPAAPK